MSGAALSGRLAVVTGAGTGIGAAISRELTRRGLAVVPTDLDEAAAARTAQQCNSPASYRLDVTDEESIAHAVAAALARATAHPQSGCRTPACRKCSRSSR